MKLDVTAIAKLRDTLLQRGRRPTLVLSAAYETLARQGMLEPDESTALQWVDPIAEAMYLTVAADGNVSEPELDALRGAVRALTDDVVRTGTLTVMVEDFARRLGEQGRETRLAAVAEVLVEEARDAEATFLLAAAMALADDQVAAEENDLVRDLGERLQIPDGRRDAILAELAGLGKR